MAPPQERIIKKMEKKKAISSWADALRVITKIAGGSYYKHISHSTVIYFHIAMQTFIPGYSM